MVRKTLPGVFMFEYQLPPAPNVSAPFSPFFPLSPQLHRHRQQQQQQQQQHRYRDDPFASLAGDGDGDDDDDDDPSRMRRGSRRSPPMVLELENDLPSVLQFGVGVNDVGGSLVVELGIYTAKVLVYPPLMNQTDLKLNLKKKSRNSRSA